MQLIHNAGSCYGSIHEVLIDHLQPGCAVIRNWTARNQLFFQTVYAAGAAFSLYTCVYAFRKSFTAATFDGMSYFNVDYKVWLVIFQVVGYACSKFLGIRVISELQPGARAGAIMLMVSIAGFSWLGFAILLPPFNVVFLFVNGLALGLVWGMVFSYLEGRSTTDALGAALATSFVISSGICRSTGAFLIHRWNVPETWMPLVAGIIFTAPLIVSLWLLDRLPPPTPEDIKRRSRRIPMNSKQRWAFIQKFLTGLILIVGLYVLLTTFREFRDNFSSDIWKSLGYGTSTAIYTTTEIPISLTCLVIIGGLVFVKDSFVALQTLHGSIFSGALLIGLSTLAFEAGWLNPPQWMTLTGLGLYLGYIPINSSYFDRLLAAFKISGTVGFVMYLADSVGYLGSVAVLLVKTFGGNQQSWLEFYIQGAYAVSVGVAVSALGCLIYFRHLHRNSLGGHRIGSVPAVWRIR